MTNDEEETDDDDDNNDFLWPTRMKIDFTFSCSLSSLVWCHNLSAIWPGKWFSFIEKYDLVATTLKFTWSIGYVSVKEKNCISREFGKRWQKPWRIVKGIDYPCKIAFFIFYVYFTRFCFDWEVCRKTVAATLTDYGWFVWPVSTEQSRLRSSVTAPVLRKFQSRVLWSGVTPEANQTIVLLSLFPTNIVVCLRYLLAPVAIQ